MYKSPIEVITSDFITKIKEDTENQILQAVQSVDVNVDKNELVKALTYDRKSYDNGFNDGVIYLGSILKRLYSRDRKILIDINRLDTIIEDVIEGD